MSVSWNTVHAMASRLQERVQGGVVTDDSRIKLALCIDEIHKARAAALKRIAKETKYAINEQYYQTIDCLKVKCKDEVCDGVKSGRKITYVDIPSTIGAAGDRAIKFLGTSDGDVSFTLKKSNSEDFSGHFPFGGASTEPIAQYELENNKRAILKNIPTPNLKFLKIKGLFSNPEDESLVSECAQTDVYPIPEDELVFIEDLAYRNIMDVLRVSPDLQDNAKPDA